MFSHREKGFIQLGIIGILVLAGGLFAVTKLASNPDLTFFNIAEEAAGNVFGQRLGVVHVAGTFPNREAQGDFLVYGAKDALSLGFQAIEIFIDPRVCRARPLGAYQTLKYCKPEKNTEVIGDSLTNLAKHEDFRKVLDMPFKRFNLTVDTIDPQGIQQWELGGAQGTQVEPRRVTQTELDATYKDFYDFAVYLSQTYKDSGKTFILINPSELDWHLTAYTGCRGNAYQGDETACIDEPASANAIANEIDYLNAVADALAKAKEDMPLSGLKIYHACEVNQVLRRSIRGKQSALTDVLPKTRCELVAYSAHEVRRDALRNMDTSIMTKALDFIAAKMPDRTAYGSKNVVISEIAFSQCQDLKCLTDKEFKDFYFKLTKEAIDWGVVGLDIWQLYFDGGRLSVRDANLNPTITYEFLSRFKRKIP